MNRRAKLTGIEDRRKLFGSLFSFGNRLQTAADSFYSGITSKQFFLLMCLNLWKEEAPTVGELADMMGSSHQNVKQLAMKLEKSGYVQISLDPEDRRKLRIQKTDKSPAMAAEHMAKEGDFMAKLFSGITEEEIQVALSVILKMDENLECL